MVRGTHLQALRVAVAFFCGAGIFTVCIVRESAHFPTHACAAVAAFGGGLALVLLNTFNIVCERHCSSTGVRLRDVWVAALLSLVCVTTGVLQFGHILGCWTLLSAALAAGEWAVVLGFAIAITLV